MADILEGNYAGVPRDALFEHEHQGKTPREYALARLLVIDDEIAAAARAGDTTRVRSLRLEKRRASEIQREEIKAHLAAATKRQAAAPAKGELEGLKKRALRLSSEIVSKTGALEKLLARLNRDPENESLLAKIDSARDNLKELRLELSRIAARQAEVDRLREDRRHEETLAGARRKFEREMPARLARLKKAGLEIVRAWQALDEGIREMDGILEKLRDLPGSPPAEVRAAIEQEIAHIGEATANGITDTASGWTIRCGGGKK